MKLIQKRVTQEQLQGNDETLDSRRKELHFYGPFLDFVARNAASF
jgi:hypothetical protein